MRKPNHHVWTQDQRVQRAVFHAKRKKNERNEKGTSAVDEDKFEGGGQFAGKANQPQLHLANDTCLGGLKWEIIPGQLRNRTTPLPPHTLTSRSSPSWMASTSISVVMLLDSARFAFSTAVRSLRTAFAFSDMSRWVAFWGGGHWGQNHRPLASVPEVRQVGEACHDGHQWLRWEHCSVWVHGPHLELLDAVLHEVVVKVLPAEVGVPAGGLDLIAKDQGKLGAWIAVLLITNRNQIIGCIP